MNKTLLRVIGVIAIVLGCVALYLSGIKEETVVAIVAAVFVLAGAIALLFAVPSTSAKIGFLQGPNGEQSSKRLYGLGCFLASIIVSFLSIGGAWATGNAAIINGASTLVAVFMASASAVFIAQAASGT